MNTKASIHFQTRRWLFFKKEVLNEEKKMVLDNQSCFGFLCGKPFGLSPVGMDKGETAVRQGNYLQCGEFDHSFCKDGEGV